MNKAIWLVLFSLPMATKGLEINKSQGHIIGLHQFAQQWSHRCVEQLSFEELELLGTFLYYDIHASEYELALRENLLNAQYLCRTLAHKELNNAMSSSLTNSYAQLIILLEQLQDHISPARDYYSAGWLESDKQIQTSDYELLKNVTHELQMLGEKTLNTWAKEHKSRFLKSCKILVHH